MKQLIENHRKPTPKKWRRIGDFALLLAIAIEPIIKSMPLEDGPLKNWMAWVMGALLIVLKFWTNTRTDRNIYSGPTQ
ncbi:MAG: hypothetical protein WC760_02980 [Bacteroidia bacterium]|jgi:hypothetical protein